MVASPAATAIACPMRPPAPNKAILLVICFIRLAYSWNASANRTLCLCLHPSTKLVADAIAIVRFRAERVAHHLADAGDRHRAAGLRLFIIFQKTMRFHHISDRS